GRGDTAGLDGEKEGKLRIAPELGVRVRRELTRGADPISLFGKAPLAERGPARVSDTNEKQGEDSHRSVAGKSESLGLPAVIPVQLILRASVERSGQVQDCRPELEISDGKMLVGASPPEINPERFGSVGPMQHGGQCRGSSSIEIHRLAVPPEIAAGQGDQKSFWRAVRAPPGGLPA